MSLERIAFTICNASYLPYAIECERSFLAHHQSGWTFLIFLVDHPRLLPHDVNALRQILSSDKSKIFAVSDIFSGSKDVSGMSLYYDITEYSTALKPWIFSYVFEHFAPASATYIDPDIQFFGSFPREEIFFGEFDCLVTPHVLTDSLNSVQQPTLQNIRSCGSYNFGFVHFENTSPSMRVIDFWRRQLVYDALISFEENLFTDQRFGDLFPCLCSVRVSHNPALNVAYWNLQERLVHGIPPDLPSVRLVSGGQEQQRDHPLIFFHFSALSPHGSIGISRHGGVQPRYARGSNKTIECLMTNYEAAIALHRQKIEDLALLLRPDLIGAIGFDHAGIQKVYRLKPQQRRDLNRFLKARAAMNALCLPPSRFVDEDSFLSSLHGFASQSDSLIRQSALNIFGAIGLQIPGLSLHPAQAGGDVERGPKAQLNIVGYPNFSFGIGRITALILEGLTNAGIRISFVVDPANAKSVLPGDLAWVESLSSLSSFNPEVPTLFLINADQLLHYINTGIAEHCFSRVCNLGYWWWELERPVPVHSEAARFLDKVLAPTRFIFDSLAHAVPSRKLVYAPLDYHELYSSLNASSDKLIEDQGQDHGAQGFLYGLGLDLELKKFATLTLMVFDFHSCIERKNPWTVLDIFSEADFTDHALIIKCSGGAAMADQYVRLIERVAAMPNVFLLDKRLSEADLGRLFSACQIYVSPHRAEGLGLNIIEADASGLATVTTNYGGISDYPFFGPGPHFRVGYRKEPISSGSLVYQPYLKGMTDSLLWAEPDQVDFGRGLRECIAQVSLLSNTQPVDAVSGSVIPVQSTTIVSVLQDLLVSQAQAVSVHRASLSKAVAARTPAAIAVVPTLSEAKRQLYFAASQLLRSVKQSLSAVKNLANVCRLILWLLLRRRMPLRTLLRSLVSRRAYLRRPRILGRVNTPPASMD
ncbi:glycosyltransferase [Synechococcus sp. CS-1328]|uniref:glycosyltransferase n=1 Tax=Synechococcus sp. CS-1328 TaxID=2847976 RepID=UPI00223AB4B4|nr:glycosyltransferase [Synechococcus sp. CS-1328]MCT0224973.1 glycosyltransferase [Synechococcus sp. CS-1328]